VSGAGAVEISAHRSRLSVTPLTSPLSLRSRSAPALLYFFMLRSCSAPARATLIQFLDPLRRSVSRGGPIMALKKHRGPTVPQKIYEKVKWTIFASFATNVPQNVTSEG